MGDAIGDKEWKIDTTLSAQRCAASVKRWRPEANGATWSAATNYCYAEFGATRIGKGCTSCQSCLFPGNLYA